MLRRNINTRLQNEAIKIQDVTLLYHNTLLKMITYAWTVVLNTI